MRSILASIGVAGLIAALPLTLPLTGGEPAAAPAVAPLPNAKPQAETAAAETDAAETGKADAEGIPEAAQAGPAEAGPATADTAKPDVSTEATPEAIPPAVLAMLPRPRPAGHASVAGAASVQIPARHSLKDPQPPFGFEPDPQLKAALNAVSEDRYRDAVAMSEQFESLANKRLIAWLVARAPNSGLSAEQILAVRASHDGWPEPEQLRLRAEQEFLGRRPPHGEIVAFFVAEPPLTMPGKLALIRALDGVGRAKSAEKELRELWRRERLGAALADRVAQEFGSRISRADHLARLHFLLYSRSDEAVAQARRLGAAHVTYARAVLAAYSRKDVKQSDNLLNGVAKQFWNDPAYRLAKARTLRRTGKPIAAARLLAKVTRAEEEAAAHDWWWEERKDLSRQL
ncbi:MAG TPA: hypothetical protein VHG92_08115, partial [Afifellaceae bacterium]|nr:hypothetical protein [Afifellaceae bacterium]